MKAFVTTCLLLAAVTWGTGTARAEANGPDFWDVTGVAANDVLNVHTKANAQSKRITSVPHNAKGLKNLGCTGEPTFAEWERMTEAERKHSARSRWCKVEYHGHSGWVAGRFLKEGVGAPRSSESSRIGAWTIICNATCALEQRGVGSAKPTVLRIEPKESNNAQISISGPGIPKQGTLSIYMDGETITQGPFTSIPGANTSMIVMSPDDITLELIRRMARHKNMVLSFPGEERGVEIQLGQFEGAWQKVQQKK